MIRTGLNNNENIALMRAWLGKNATALLFVSLFIFLFILSLLSEGSYGGSDDVCHFRTTKYAWDYPRFFFDQWNKPLFTLLAFPFAQLGFEGMRLFNIIAGLLASFLAYKTAVKLKLNNSWLVTILIVFSPVYMALLLSSMTEILFSLGIILTVFLFYSEKPVWAAMVASFLPFCRIEGFLIIPIIFLVFVINKKWKALPFLGLGFVLYTLIGFPVFKDWLWVIHTIPYSTTSNSIYGKGDLFFYVKSAKDITGLPITFLIIIGLCYSVWQAVYHKSIFTIRQINEFLLIFAPVFVIVAFHSIAWWLGNGALGLTRLMAPVIPLAAIYGLKGYNCIEKQVHWPVLRAIFLGVVLYFVVVTPFKIYEFPIPLTGEQKVIKKATDWFISSEYKNNRIYYYEPYVCFFLGVNPYDTKKVHEFLPNRDKPEDGVEPGGIIFWDAHFTPNEGGLKLETLMQSPFYKLIHIFQPVDRFIVLGGHDYSIYLFERIDGNDSIDNDTIEKQLLSGINNSWILKYKKKQDFETPKGEFKGLVKNISHTGDYSLKVDANDEYSPVISFRINEVTDMPLFRLKASCFVYGLSKESLESASLVASIQHHKDTYIYKTSTCPYDSIKTGKWTKLEVELVVDKIQGAKDLVKVYIWNRKRSSFLMDDLKVECFEKKD